MVDALWTSYSGFNETNVQDLFNKINGASGTTFAQIQSLANSKMTASQIRAKTYGKTSSQDIEVVLGGLEWEVVYLSTDTDGNAILTLWLDNNQQPGWTGKSQTEGAFYGFYDGGLYSDWSADWTSGSKSQGTAAFYPSNMYGTSYIRAVTLNNGGQYATSNTALTNASQNPSSVFAPFTMSSSGLYNYIVTPAKVSWQEKQSATATGGAPGSYDYPNDEWNPSTEKGKYYSDAGNYVEHNGYNAWKDDKIWLPSMAETGYNDSHLGLWGVSIDQRKNYNGSTEVIQGQKVGGENTQNTSQLVTFSWLRSSDCYGGTTSAQHLRPSGSECNDYTIDRSFAVRPALHLNLTSIVDSMTNWRGHTSGKDFANSGHQGTESDSYEISSAEDLAQLAVDVNGGKNYEGKYFKLTSDIYLGGLQWTPIGQSKFPFKGNFNGDGHSINRLTITDSQTSAGLFGNIDSAYIYHLTLNYASITALGYSSGALVGDASNSTINNVTTYGDISSINENNQGYAGGLVGYITNGTITNVRCYGNIAAGYNAGGIVGEAMFNTTIKNAFAGCVLLGDYGGGIGGVIDGGSVVNCVVGGVLGRKASGITAQAGTSMINCYVIASADDNDFSPFGAGGATACYAIINNKKYISTATTDSAWTDGWAIVKNLNNGLPIQKELYSVASVATSTLSQFDQVFDGFTLKPY